MEAVRAASPFGLGPSWMDNCIKTGGVFPGVFFTDRNICGMCPCNNEHGVNAEAPEVVKTAEVTLRGVDAVVGVVYEHFRANWTVEVRSS
jgi:hypothetical protein